MSTGVNNSMIGIIDDRALNSLKVMPLIQFVVLCFELKCNSFEE